MSRVDEPKNALGEPLELCSRRPLSGFTRNGSCDTGSQDVGVHTVCVRVTQAFLDFSRARGNDLVTPVPKFDFPGLAPGDQWCVCAARWREALEGGCAPHVLLRATHVRTLEIVELTDLKARAIDLS